MARRSTNSHAARVKALPHVARLHRTEPFRPADQAELKAAADRIAGPTGWYAVAGWAPADIEFRLYGFATAAQAEAMQRWIAESGIETRPAPRATALPRPSCESAPASPCRAAAGPLRARHKAVDLFGRQVGADVAAEIGRGLVQDLRARHRLPSGIEQHPPDAIPVEPRPYRPAVARRSVRRHSVAAAMPAAGLPPVAVGIVLHRRAGRHRDQDEQHHGEDRRRSSSQPLEAPAPRGRARALVVRWWLSRQDAG